MHQTTRSKSSIFLLELILCILIFSIASAIVIQLFAKSRLLSRSAADVSGALLQSQSVADLIRDSGSLTAAADAFGCERPAGDSLTIYYSEDWSPSSSTENAAYRLTAQLLAEQEGLRQLIVTVTPISGTEELFRLDTKLHPPLTVSSLPG